MVQLTVTGLFLCLFAAPSFAADVHEITFINDTEHRVKAAAPGGKAVRLKPGEKGVMQVEETKRIGVEAKAWWVHRPRDLCVIFVRYGGTVRIADRGVKVASGTTLRCVAH